MNYENKCTFFIFFREFYKKINLVGKVDFKIIHRNRKLCIKYFAGLLTYAHFGFKTNVHLKDTI